MACNKFLTHSKISLSYNLTHKVISNHPQSFLKLITKEASSFRSHQHISQCHYSTVFSIQKSLHRKSNLYTIVNCTTPVSFMSTKIDHEKFHVVMTNPSESNVSSTSSSISQLSEVSSSAVDSSTIAVNATSTNVSDIAATLSTELQNASQYIEPSLASLDLAHWTPPGLIQMLLEYIHVSWGLPWWGTIVASTIVARILMFPILIKTQRNAINMSNYMPQLQYLQSRFGEARKSGNPMEASRYAYEISEYMKLHKINPLKSALLPLAQAPVFISFFLGLRGMAKAPVESMQWGGIGWTMDLTVPDPYYILPVMSCATLYIGAESGVKLEHMKLTRYLLQALPVVALPFCINFPAAVLYYWVTTNFCTLAIVSILKVQPIRDFLNLPTQRPLDPKFVLPKKGFVGSVKEAYEDQKVLATIQDRRRIDSMRFQKAGTGPLPRTYSYDPTKPRPSSAAAAALAARQQKS
ncbi:mitochondrial inner membrane protein OXA1L [Caerostris darwini]|uniref:Mitochondrial inner membrane protein OXA1L n=1 Tax=Caerostris darwini TaxID=1538125 RepID=A0AAV4RR29_9ARAC|nr:mitochondrial inner membrane protein OXA1L [Caerostris darwini]